MNYYVVLRGNFYLNEKNVEKLLKECMESAIQMSVPLLVEAEVADNWYEVK